MTPTLHYQLAPCALGQLLLAASPRGIAWLALGDQPQALCAELLAAYPDAALCSDGSLHVVLVAAGDHRPGLAGVGLLGREVLPRGRRHDRRRAGLRQG